MFNRISILISMVILALSGCTCSPKSGPSTPASTEAAATEEKVVNLAIWSNSIPDDLVAKFTESTGIKVQITNYSSNEELLAKLQAGATGYDVAVPSDYMVSVMIKLNLLEPLNRARLTNFDGVEADMLHKAYDPNSTYSVPYTRSFTGIGVNRALYKGPITSWNDLFANPKLAGKFSLLDDVRESLGAALKSLGYSLNSQNSDELAAAKKVLVAAKQHVKAFSSEPMDSLIRGEVQVAHIYACDALQANRKTGGKVEFVLPSEGATLDIDNLVVPKGTLHPVNAHTLINFLLLPESNFAVVDKTMAGPVIKGVKAMLSPAIQAMPGIFPTADLLSKTEMMRDLGDANTVWDRTWTEVKAGSH